MATDLRPPRVFSDRGCPYAHRVLALLDHLGVTPELHEAPAGRAPAELGRWSPSHRLPLLVHGGLTIGESRVMLEHLAEAYGFAEAYPLDLDARSRHRHAMAMIDMNVAPRLARGDAGVDPARLAEVLDGLAAATTAPPAPSLLAFHAAPVWLRLQWWRPDSVVTRAIRGRPALAAWLDGAAALDAVVRTAPARAANTADFHAACARGELAAS